MENNLSLQLIRISTDSSDYPFCEQLYTNAFPPAERREINHQRAITENNTNFFFNALRLENTPMGFLTYWVLGDFIYIEHFAVDESMRGKRIGRNILQLLHQQITRPAILEVERPDTELAVRRIHFYERCGYTLWKSDYLQPPYEERYSPLPLYLMCHGALNEQTDYERIKETLYKEVYKWKD